MVLLSSKYSGKTYQEISALWFPCFFLYPYTSNKTRHNYYICNDVQLNQVRLIPISEQHTLSNVRGYSKIKMLDLLNSHHFAFIQLSKIATSSFFRVVFFIIKKLNSTGWISQIIARYSFRRFFSLSFKINSLPPLVLHSRIIRLYDLNLLFSIHVIRYEKTPSQMALSVTHGLQYEKSSLFHRCIYVNSLFLLQRCVPRCIFFFLSWFPPPGMEVMIQTNL